MKTWLTALAFISIVGLTVGTAEARQEWLGFLPPLTKADMELAQKAARVDMEGQPEGTALRWQNSESGNSGAVVLIRRYQSDGRECRRLQHHLKIKGEQDIRVLEVTICLQEDGSWKWP
jgi:surface antigen